MAHILKILDTSHMDESVPTGVALQAFGNDILGLLAA